MKGEEGESPIPGDLLEVVLTYVPLLDLVSACHVSKSWEFAVSSSLSHLNKVKPWLIIHTQCIRSKIQNTIQAYDHRSNTWVEITQPPQKYTSNIQTSDFNLLYAFTSKEILFSCDPLHLTWTHITTPRVCRVDPIIAQVGSHIVVAGGAFEFEDDPLCVEMYDMAGAKWSTCQSMPHILKDSASSTWLSVTANQNIMYVTTKSSGITYSFSPETKAWSGPYILRPDPGIFSSAVGFSGEDLIMAGLFGHAQNVNTLKLWKIKQETWEFEEIGEIPIELLEKLKGENMFLSSISLMATENLVYICNSSDPGEFIFIAVVDGEWKWGSIKNLVLNDERRIQERMIMSCGRVGIRDLQIAMKSEGRKFLAIKSDV